MPHQYYLHNQLLCKYIKIIYFRWERDTQGDPTAVGAYALDILALIKLLLEFVNLNAMNAKEVVFPDDLSVAGSLNNIKDYWDHLTAMAQNTVTSLNLQNFIWQ